MSRRRRGGQGGQQPVLVQEDEIGRRHPCSARGEGGKNKKTLFATQILSSIPYLYPQTLLRKPAVEKMRRDRINHSIEQLKVLLEREFQRHQPNTKLEKADILETAVSYLKKQRQMHEAAPGAKHPELDFNTGYLRCLREAFYFLSFCQPKGETQSRLIKHFCQMHNIPDDATFSLLLSPAPKRPSAAEKRPPPPASAFLWRPW